MKLKFRGSLFHCGRCGKDHSNPLGHVCLTRLDRKDRGGKTAVALRAKASLGQCNTCGKQITNPMTHKCLVKTDFKRRRAIAGKGAAATQAHLYETCRDKECQRLACRAYKEGREEGYQEGYAHGHEDGHTQGYDVGHRDGVNDCPRKHA